MLLGLALAGLCLASLLALLAAYALYGISMQQFANLAAMPDQYPHGWDALMLYQGLSLAGTGAGVALLPRLLGQPVARYFSPRRLGATWWLVAAGLVILCSVPFLSAILTWNANAHFPSALHDFEAWARDKEDQAAGLTKFLTDFSSAGRLLVGSLARAHSPWLFALSTRDDTCRGPARPRPLIVASRIWQGTRHRAGR